MENELIRQLASELNKSETAVKNVVTLLDEGNTIPFIARYRKELHGAMDDTSLRNLEERLKYLRALNDRKEEVKRLISEQEKLTPELSKKIDKAEVLSAVEDLYRPFRPKRRTRASIAREKGLEPLAQALLKQDENSKTPKELAAVYIDPKKGVNSAEDALAGASDIIAESVSDDADIRAVLGRTIRSKGTVTACAQKEEDSVYSLYYDFSQRPEKLAGHQILALNRGEKEGFLKVSVDMDRDSALSLIERAMIRKPSPAADFLRGAIKDGYERLLFPSLENEIRSALTEAACEGAIKNFALNLKPLLMQPPVKGHVTMGLDPGYRMGCKVAVVDPTGKVLDTTVVYPTYGDKQKNEAIAKLSTLVQRHQVTHIAIGNGTASRETEQMTVELIKKIPSLSYMIVNEAGASVYSASELAAKEFPEYDVNLRSAVSIARRLQDPLAELVKIDPKAIGVGQYQHDMPQKRLDESLSAVVEDCVNAVGADLNTASASLLRHIAGINQTIAENIVKYREENGKFTSRSQLKKVAKLGPKAFEQCAGFLRIPESKNILDNTGVHPESYDAAKKLLSICGYTEANVKNGELSGLSLMVENYGREKAAADCGIGVLTMSDIISELKKPGRDIRDSLPAPVFRKDVLEMKDLKPGMELAGTVHNVIDFGAFVDIGVHQDGLVHISEICDRFLRHPSEVLSVGDNVKVTVLSVDERRKRISLSMKRRSDKI